MVFSIMFSLYVREHCGKCLLFVMCDFETSFICVYALESTVAIKIQCQGRAERNDSEHTVKMAAWPFQATELVSSGMAIHYIDTTRPVHVRLSQVASNL